MPETIIRPNSELTLNQVQFRANDVLQQDEWKRLDERVVRAARNPLRFVNELVNSGMTFDLGEEGYMSTMQLDYQNQTDLDDASVVMDPITETAYDRPKFSTFSVPLPLIIREFAFSSRNLMQSRKLGQPLDTSSAESAIFRASEKLEDIAVNGLADFSFKGNSIEGITNATNRITATFSSGAWDTATPTGEDMLVDLIDLVKKAEAQKFFGPYKVFIPRAASSNLAKDFKANSDKSIRERLLEHDSIEDIVALDKLADGNVILVQMTPGNVIELVRGFDPRVVQWEGRGGFQNFFMAIAGNSVRIHTDAGTGKSGIVHMT